MKFLISAAILVAATVISANQVVSAAPVLVVQAGPRGAVRALQISPDGSKFASLSDEALQVWTRGGELLWSKTMLEPQEALAWSNDGRKIAVGVRVRPSSPQERLVDTTGALEVDAQNGEPLRTLLHGSSSVTGLRYLPDSDLRVDNYGRPTYWDEAGRRKTRSFLVWPRATFDGLTLRFLNADGGTTARAIPLFSLALQPKIFTSAEHALAWSPDGAAVYCARTDFPNPRYDGEGNLNTMGAPRAYLWRVHARTGQAQELKRGTRQAIFSVACWRDETLILGGASGENPEIWKGELRFATLQNGTLKPTWSAPQPLQPARNLQISPDGQTLAIGGEDTAIRLWNLANGRLDKTLKTYSSGIQALDFSPDGRQLAALDYSHLFVWNIEHQTSRRFSGMPAFGFAGMPAFLSIPLSLAWAPDGQSLAMGGATGLKIWNAKTLEQRDFRAGSLPICPPLRWTSSGIWAFDGLFGSLGLHDPKTAATRRVIDGTGTPSESKHDGPTKAFVFARRSQKLWTLGGDTENRINLKRWDVAANRVERTLEDVFLPRAISLSPDETILAVAAPSGVFAFDSTSLSPLWKTNFEAPANSLTWSRDEKWLAVTGEDGWTRVLDDAGHLLRKFAVLPAPKSGSTGREWVSLAENGVYLGSKDAAKYLRWREGETLLPFDSQSVTSK